MGRTYLFGFITGMSLATLLYLLNTLIEVNPANETSKEERFQIVDNYKGCDVVRWTNSNLAHYQFFLDCRSSK